MNKNIFYILLALLFTGLSFGCILQDEFIEDLRPEEKKETIYNFENYDKIGINIRIKNEIKSEKELYEGQEIEFTVEDNVFRKKCLLIKKNTTIKAKVNLIITSGMNGIPASVIFSDFIIPGLKKENISPELEIFGQDRSLLVFPLKWALTPLPPTGSLTNFIKGGKVKIKPNKTYTIFYHPNWS